LPDNVKPLPPDLLEEIRKLDTPTISNILEPLNIRPWTEGFTRPEIRCVFPEMGTMAGYAVTLSISASSQGKALSRDRYWQAILDTPAPRVVVIHDRDYPNPIGSFWGEVQGNIARGLDCVGCVTDGGVRDLKEVEALGFQFFAKEILVSQGYRPSLPMTRRPERAYLDSNHENALVHESGALVELQQVAREEPFLEGIFTELPDIVPETKEVDALTRNVDSARAHGVTLTLTSFLLKAAALALREGGSWIGMTVAPPRSRAGA
jgi:hypothetical protein